MSAPAGHELRLENLGKRFGQTLAVQDIDLTVGAGELVALLGPSGCGKSTLLRIISGFMRQTQGRVLFDGQPVDHLPANRRGVGIVFQNYALFPHLSVRDNVAYGLVVQRRRAEEIAQRVDDMLAMVQMTEFADRLPAQLSGGQQQRIALARCLAVDPKILLLDEPFGALDKNLRLDMQLEVRRLQQAYGITTVLVTHDQEEAMSMADRIAVMSRGRIEQVSGAVEIYDRPQTMFVNQFVGTTNTFHGVVEGTDGAHKAVRLGTGELLTGQSVCPLHVGDPVIVSIRPEQMQMQDESIPNAVAGTIASALPLGPVVLYDVRSVDGASFKVSLPRSGATALMSPGRAIYASPAPSAHYRLFPGVDAG